MKGKTRKYIRKFREEMGEHPKKVEINKFLGKLLIAGFFFQLILFMEPDTYLLQEGLTSLVGSITTLLGYSFTAEGTSIVGKNAIYIITRDCLGWKSMSVFAALVFATPKARDRLKIFIGGLAILLAANIVRIVSTVILAEHGIISFDIIHTFLWRWGMSLVVLILWFTWFSEDFNFSRIQGIFK